MSLGVDGADLASAVAPAAAAPGAAAAAASAASCPGPGGPTVAHWRTGYVSQSLRSGRPWQQQRFAACLTFAEHVTKMP